MKTSKFFLTTLFAAAAMTASTWAGDYTVTGTVKANTTVSVEGTNKTLNQLSSEDTIIFRGATGYLVGWNNGSIDANIKLVDNGSAAAFTWNDGSSTTTHTITFNGALSGDGTFKRDAETQKQSFVFAGDLSAFEGNFVNVDADIESKLSFGTGAAAPVSEKISGTGKIDWVGQSVVYNYAKSDSYEALTIDNSSITAGSLEFTGGASYVVKSSLAVSGTLSIKTGTLNFYGTEATLGKLSLAETGTVNIGDGTNATTVSVDTLRTNDTGNTGENTLNINKNATLKITGTTNSGSYSNYSVLLGHWKGSSQVNVAGTFDSKDTVIYMGYGVWSEIGSHPVTLTVLDGGVVNAKGIGKESYAPAYVKVHSGGTVNIDAGDFEFNPGALTSVTNSGAINLSGEKTSFAAAELQNAGTISLANGATLSVGDLYGGTTVHANFAKAMTQNYENATIIVADADGNGNSFTGVDLVAGQTAVDLFTTLPIEDGYTLAILSSEGAYLGGGGVDVSSNGTLNIALGSTLAYSGSIAAPAGTITVDTTGFDGSTSSYRVIDYTGTGTASSYEGITFDNKLVFNSDLYVSTQTQDVLYVNSEDYAGATGEVTGSGRIIGYNAFGGIKEALETAADGTTVMLNGNVTEAAVEWFAQGQITINNSITLDSKSKDYVLNYNKGYYVHVADVVDADGNTTSQGKLVVTDKVKSEYSGQYRAWSNGEIELYGDIDTYQLWAGRGGKVTIGETADVYMTYGDGMIKIRNGGTIVVNGSLTSTDGELSTMKQQLHGGYISVDNGVDGLDDRLELNNTYVSSAWLVDDSKDGGKFTLAMDNSILELGKLTFNDEAEANISNGSKLLIAGAITVGAESTINVANSSVRAASVTNSGTIAVSGNSTLNVDSFNGSGKVLLGEASNASAITLAVDGGNASYSIVDGSTVTLSGNLSTSGKIQSSTYNYASGSAADTAIQGYNLTIAGDIQAYAVYASKGSAVTVQNGAKLAASSADGHEGYMNVYGGTLTVEEDGEVTSSIMNLTGNAVIKGSMSAGDINIYAGRNADQKAGNMLIDGGSLSMTNRSINVGSTASADKYYTTTADGAKKIATLRLDNGAVVELKNNDNTGYGMNVVAGALVDIQGGSSLTIGNTSGHLTNAGTVRVAGSTLNVTNVANSGRFNVAGESTLNVGTFTGGNAIYAADGAVIKDSTIGGATVFAEGDLTFKGTNTIGALNPGWYNHKITIDAGDSLKTTGSRSTFSYGNTIDVDGEIAEAKAVADKTQLTKSLELVGGWSLAGNGTANGKNATLDVDNAYVSFGKTTSKNSSATGTFVLDFNNSIVDFTEDFQTAASTVDGLAPEFQLNVTDSVMNVGTRFAFSHENSTAVVDNSTVTIAQQFKNVGEFTLRNGSEMTVGSNADGPSYEKTGNSGTLNVTSGSTFDMSEAANASYPLYNEGTINVDGATFKAGSLNNQGTTTVSGESTLNIAAASGNRIQIADGATLVESTIGGGITGLGMVNVKDVDGDGTGLTISGAAYFGGNNTSSDTFSGGFSGDDVRINSTLLLWNGTYTINANVSTVNMYLSSYDAKTTVGAGYTVSSDVCTWIRDTVTLEDGAKLTAGSLWLDNADATLIVNEGATVTVSKDNAQNLGLKNQGTITVNGGSLVDTELGLTNEGVIDLNDGSIQAVTIKNTGTLNLTIGENSSFVVGSFLGENGAINVTLADGFSGNKLLIDAGAASNYGTVTTATGINSTVLNNDLYVTDQNQEQLYVNSAYTGAIGSTVDGTGYLIGYNAFNSIQGAVDAAADNTTEINLAGDLSGKVVAANGKTLTFTGEANIDWSKGWFMVGRGATDAVATEVTFKDALISVGQEYAWTVSTGFNVAQDEGAGSGKANGTLNIENSQIVTAYLANRNVVNVKGDGIADGIYGYGTEGAANLTVLNGFYVSRDNSDTLNAEMNLTAGAYVKVEWENSMGIGYGSGRGVLNITDSKFEASGDQVGTNPACLTVHANGAINVNNGILKVDNTLTNSGMITVSGTSTLDIDTLTGTGNVQVSGTSTLNIGKLTADSSTNFVLADDTTLNASTIGGDGDTLITVAGDLNIADNVTLDKIYYLRTDRTHQGDLTIAEDKTLTINGNVQYYNGDITGGGKLVVSGGFVYGSPNSTLSTISTDVTVGYGYLYENVAIDGATLTLNANNGEVLYLGANDREANVVVKNGGAIVSEKPSIFINEGGDLAVENGTITANIKINHAESTFTVSGDSAVSGTISGSGSLIFDGAVIDGDIALSGKQDTIRFVGDNTMTSALGVKGSVYAGTMLSSDEDDSFAPEASSLAISGVTTSFNELFIGAQYKDGNEILSTVTVKDNSTVAIDEHGGAGLVIRNSGVLNIESGSKVSVENDIPTIVQGVMNVAGTFTNTALENNAVNYGPFTVYKGGKVTVEDGGVVSIGKYEYNTGTASGIPRIGLDADGKDETYQSGFVVVENGGTFTANGNLTVNTYGQVDVNGGDFSVAETLTNKGKINVSGGGTITAGSIANNGAVNVSGGGTITAESFEGGSGKITVDMAGITSTKDNYYTAINVKGSNAASFGTVSLTNAGSNISYVKGNDLLVLERANTFYVNSDNNSLTEWYGYDQFNSYDAAYAYYEGIKKTSFKAEMIIEKGSFTLKNEHKNYKNLDVVVEDGAVLQYAGNKLDMTYDITVKAGGSLLTTRPAGKQNYTHIKEGGVFTVGESGSDKKAVVNFLDNGTYAPNSVAVLYDGKMVVNNAIFKVGDLGLPGTASFTDAEVTVGGIVAFGKNAWYSQTMTNSTMVVKGHNIRGDNKYFSANGSQLNKLTMDNSSIVIDDGVDSTVAEAVTLGTLTMTNNSSVTVEAGTAVTVTGTVKLTESTLDVGALTINSGRKINMDYMSQVAFDSITNNGSINVDTSAYTTGLYKIMDYTGDASFTAAQYADVIDVSGNFHVVDSDLWLSDGSTGTLYVKDDYAGMNDGTAIDGKVGVYYGFNAGHSLADVVQTALAIGNSTATTEIALEDEVYASAGNATSARIDLSALTDKTLTISGNMGANESLFAELNDDKDETAVDVQLVLEAGEFAASKLKADNNATIQINNAKLNGVYVDASGTGTALLYAKNSGVITVDHSTLNSMRLSLASGGTMNITDSSLYYNGGQSITVDGTGSTLTITGSDIDVDAFSVVNGGKMVLSGSTLDESNGGEGSFSVGADSTLEIVNSSLTASSALTNAGTISIDGTTFVAASVNNSNGEFIVAGDSKLNIGSLSGKIHVQGDSTITDSSIGGRVDMVGGVTNWVGTNTVNGIFSAGYANYGSDITVNITGNFNTNNLLMWGGNNGNQTTVNVGSASADRTTFHAGQIGMFEDYTLNVADAVLNITNADVTYDYTFIRSVVNITDSTFTATSVNTYVAGDAKVVVDNSTWDTVTGGGTLDIGCYGVDYNRGNADVTIRNGSIVNANKIRLENTDDTDYEVSFKVDGSQVTANSIEIGAEAVFSLDNAATVVSKGTMTAAGDLTVSGGSALTLTNGGQLVLGTENGTADSTTVISGEGTKVWINHNEGTLSQQNNNSLEVSGGANLTANSTIKIAGHALFTDAGTTANTVYTSVYGENASELATLTIADGATLTSTGTIKVGHTSNADRDGAIVVNGATITADSIFVQDGSSFTVTGNSTINATLASGWMVADGATLNGAIVNNSSIGFVNDNILSTDISGAGKVYVGQNGTSKDLDATLTIDGDRTVNGIDFYVDDNADLIIGSDDKLTFNGSGSYQFRVIGGDVNIAEGGVLNVDGTSMRFSRSKNSVIAGTMNVDGQTCIYGSNVTVDGLLDITHGENMADTLIIGYSNSASIGDIDTTANLVVNGTVTVNGGDKAADAQIKLYTDEKGKVGTLTVNDGGVFETDGTITNAGAIAVNGGTLTAGTIDNTSTITVDGSTFTADSITTSKRINIKDSIVDIGTVSSSTSFALGFQGRNTVTIDNVAGNYLWLNGDVTLVDSAISGSNYTVLAYGDLVAEGSLTINGGTLWFEKATDGKISGSDITVDGTTMFQLSKYDLQNKLTSEYAYFSAGSDVTISGNFNVNNAIWIGQNKNSSEDSYEGKATVTGSFTAGGLILGYDSKTAILDVDGGTLAADSVTVNTGSSLSLENDATATISGAVSNAGTITVDDSTFKADKVDNESIFLISGTSTVQIEDATGSGWSYRVSSGATLKDSYIKTTDNSTLRMLGSMTVEGGLSVGYLQGASTGKDGVGGTLKIADGSTINASYGVEFSNDYTLEGGKIVLSGGNASGALWGFVFQNGTYDINTDIEIDGGGDATPLHFTNATATVRSDISQSNPGGEVIYLSNSKVEVNGGSLTSDTGIHINNGSTLTVNSGAIDANVMIGDANTMTVSGESALDIALLSGTGTLVFSGASLTDAKVGGAGFAGSVEFSGTQTTFSGSGSVVDLSGADVSISTALNVVSDAEVTLGKVMSYGAITVDAAELIFANGGMFAGVTVTGDGDVTLTSDVMMLGGVVTLKNGDLDLENGAKLGGSANVAMDHLSTVTYDGVTIVQTGTIKVDTSLLGEMTIHKVVDYVGSGTAMDYSSIEGDHLVSFNGDLYATKVGRDTLYLNKDYPTMDEEDLMEEGKLVGYNAYGSYFDAISEGLEPGTTKRLHVDGTVMSDSGIADRYFGTLAITGENDATVDFDGNSFRPNSGSRVTVDSSVTLDNIDQLMALDNGTQIVLNGEVNANQIWVSCSYNGGANITINAGADVNINDQLSIRGGTMNVIGNVVDRKTTTEEASLTWGWGQIGYNGWWTTETNNLLNITNAVVSGSGSLQIGNANNAQGELRATNSVVSVGSILMPGINVSGTNYGQWVTLNNSTLNVKSKFDIGMNGRVVASGSDITADTITTAVSDNGKANIELKGGSLTANSITNAGMISVEDGSFNAGTVTNSGTFNVTGDSSLAFDTFVANGNTNLVGQNGDVAGTHKVTLGSSTADTAAEFATSSSSVYFHGADVTLNSDVEVNIGKGKFFYFKNSTLDLNGKTLDVNLAKFLTNNLNVTGTGNIVIGGDVTTDMPCWQGNNVIDENVTVTSYEQENIYGNLTVYGTVETYNGTNNNGGNGVDRVGVVASGFEYSHDAVLTVSGDKASYTIYGGPGFEVATATNGLIVEDGASFDMRSGTFTNYGSVTVSDGASMTIGGTLTNKSTMTIDNASSVIANKLNVEAGASVTITNAGSADSLVLAQGGTVAGSITGGNVLLGWDEINDKYVAGNLAVTGSMDVEDLYVYMNSELAIEEDGSLDAGYFISWGEISANKAASFNVDALYLYGRETLDGTNYPTGDQLGKLTLVETNATIGRLQLGRVKDTANNLMGDASVSLTNSTLTVGTLAHGGVSGNEDHVIALTDSTLNVTTGALSSSGTIKAEGTSSFTVGTMTNSGYITVEKGASFAAGSIVNNHRLALAGSGTFDVGNIEGTGNFYIGYGYEYGYDKAAFTVASGETLNIKQTNIYTYYTDLTIEEGATLNTTTTGKLAINIYRDGDSKFTVAGTMVHDGLIQLYGGEITETGKLQVVGKNQLTTFQDGELLVKGILDIDTVNALNIAVGVDSDTFATYKNNTFKLTVSGDKGVLDVANNAIVQKNSYGSGALTIEDGAQATIGGTLTNKSVIYVEDGSLTANSYTDGGVGAQLYVSGTSTIAGGDFAGDTKLRIGQLDEDRDGSYDRNADGSTATTDYNNVTLDVDSLSLTFANSYNADITLARDLTITMTGVYGNGYFFMDNTDLDLGGHTLTFNGMLTANVDIANGTMIFDGTKGEAGWSNLVFQDAASSIADDATVKVVGAGQVTIYEDLTVSGTYIDESAAGNATLVGHANAGDATNGANLVVSGANASWTQVNDGMTIYGANAAEGIEASSVTVSDGATMTIGGTLNNMSSMFIDNGASVVVDSIKVGEEGSVTITNAGKADSLVLVQGGTVAGSIMGGNVTLGWAGGNDYVDATLDVTGSVDVDKLYVYVNSELAINEGGSLDADYFISWGEISANKAASFNVDALYLYGRETLEGTDYPTGDQLGKLTLVETNATIGRLQLGRVKDTANNLMGDASVSLTKSTLTVGTLAHGDIWSGDESQTITVDGDSKLKLVNGGALAGTLNSEGEVTLGWAGGNDYVDATLNVTGSVDADKLYVYMNSELAINEGGSLDADYFISWGEISANKAASFNVDALYLYGRETLDGTGYPAGDKLGKLTLTETNATIGRLQLGRVKDAANKLMGDAAVSLTNSTLTVGTLAHGDIRSGDESQTITLNNSTLNVTKSGALSTAGKIAVQGKSNLSATTLSGGTVAIEQDAVLTVTGTSAISSTVEGVGALVVDAAKVTLSGANTYTGGTTLAAGTAVAGNNRALGDGDLTIVGGGANLEISEGVTLEVNALKLVLGEANIDTAIISGSGSLKLTNSTITVSKATQQALSLAAGAAQESFTYRVTTDLNTGWTKSNFELDESWGTWVVQSFDNGVLTLAIPEPATFGLLSGLAALIFVGGRRRRRNGK